MNAPQLSEEDRPLRISAIAEWLGVSEKTVRRRMDELKIKSFKMGGLRVSLRRDVRAYWEKLTQGGGEHV